MSWTRPGRSHSVQDMALAREELGRRIADAKERSGMTLQEIGDQLDTDWRVVQRWSKGTNAPRAGTLNRLADVLGVERDYFQEPQRENVLERVERKLDENTRALRTTLGLLDVVVARLDQVDQSLATHDDLTGERVATILGRLEAVEARADTADQALSRFQQEFVQALGGDDPQPPATRSEPGRNTESKTNQGTRREAG